MDAEQLALAWRRAVASVADSAVRAAYARSEITRWPPELLAGALDHLCLVAEQGATDARDVLGAMAPALGDENLATVVAAVRACAVQQGVSAVVRLLGLPRPTAVEDVPLAHLAASASGRPLTLGERKTAARGRSRRTLEKLMRDPDASVVRVLLLNPRLTEDDIVRMAARRPGRREVLAEIARTERWALRARVRLTLVCNPATPLAVTLPLLPLLSRPELAFAATVADLPEAVRAAIEARTMTTGTGP